MLTQTFAARAFSVICALTLTTGVLASVPVFAGEDADCCKDMAGGKSTCSTCKVTCEKTLAYCKKKGGKHADAKHTKIMQDCITMCRTTCELSKNGSALAAKAAALCAEACKTCAESCEKFDDKVMKDCAAECRKCSDACTSGEGCKAKNHGAGKKS